MCQNEHERLAAQFHDLLDHHVGQNQSLQERAITAWFRAVPAELRQFAFDLISISKVRAQIEINTGVLILGDIDMSDKSTNVDTGGGDITGSAIGAGARVIAQTIQSIKGNVGSSGNIDAEGQKLISGAAEAIGATTSLEDDEKRQALDDLEKLAAEAAKATPRPSLLKRAWESVKLVAGAIPTITELGKWLCGRFPEVFGD